MLNKILKYLFSLKNIISTSFKKTKINKVEPSKIINQLNIIIYKKITSNSLKIYIKNIYFSNNLFILKYT
jgi:flagellar basal body-associated protein FliL